MSTEDGPPPHVTAHRHHAIPPSSRQAPIRDQTGDRQGGTGSIVEALNSRRWPPQPHGSERYHRRAGSDALCSPATTFFGLQQGWKDGQCGSASDCSWSVKHVLVVTDHLSGHHVSRTDHWRTSAAPCASNLMLIRGACVLTGSLQAQPGSGCKQRDEAPLLQRLHLVSPWLRQAASAIRASGDHCSRLASPP